MPLQNRVTPFGEIVAIPERGTLMGNRGGRIHDDAQRLGRGRWTSRRWIACELSFRGVRRPVMGKGYTELFFLDEVTALAAGHRPCFYCRRREARAFARAFAEDDGSLPGADDMDAVLHAERLDGSAKRVHRAVADELPDGSVVLLDGTPHALREDAALPWSPGGWVGRRARPRGCVALLTPLSVVTALRNGFSPRWHESARIFFYRGPPP
jgi:hypothetical protein